MERLSTTARRLVVLGAALYLIAARTLERSWRPAADGPSRRVFASTRTRAAPAFGFSFGGNSSGTIALLADENGDALNPARRPRATCRGIPGRVRHRAPLGRRASTSETTEISGVPVRGPDRDGRPRTSGTVFIQVIQDRTTEQATLDAMLRLLLVGGAVVVLVAIGFGAIYARRALVPIRESLGRPARSPCAASASSPPTPATSCGRR